ncbi:neuroligin-3-like [Mercenaria mercenaria]|uniref:neuroligin-3-like n=1 Tax=Mercenaria mercenaria TaxID=6596 RepID=UPI00234EC23C|nr:neuroligin-3-like [Mercenaria mercenaria]
MLKKHPTDLYKLAESEPQSEIEFFRSLKLINGINGAEGALFIMMMGRPEDLDQLEITREQINNHHIPGAISQIYGADKKVPNSVKQLLIAEYTDWESPDDPKRLREQVLRLNGDTYFNVSGIEMSRIHANASNVDSYVYNFIPQLHKRSLPTPALVKKAVRGDEIAPLFVYNFVIYKDKTDLPPQWEYDLSRRMITYWTNFAKSGDPNKPVRNASPSLIWPKYSMTSQKYTILDKEDTVRQFLYAREFAFWRNTLPALFGEAERAQTLTSEYGNQVDESCEKDGNCDGG